MAGKHPIIVGVGQVTNRSTEIETAPHPIELAKMAAQNCVKDCECSNVLKHVDCVTVVNIFSWLYEDPAGMLCEMLDIQPKKKKYTSMGGNTPQWLVNHAADQIMNGETEMALLVGAESMGSVTKARRAGIELSWPGLASGMPAVIDLEEQQGANNQEMIHGAAYPIQVYPLFENALRAESGLSINEHRKALGEFCAKFSRVAANNPLAWFTQERSSDEITGITEKNRMIGFPYTKFMNSITDVNQAAGVIVTSTEVAERLGIPKNKWVYLHGGADANDKWFVSERVNYSFSPAINEISRAALDMAGIGLNQVDFMDLYSCFPCAVMVGAKSMGLDMNALPPLTITGGLAYFGGAGNNYTMHSIAHAVERLRANPDQFAYISALGWFITKHAVGIYSGREPQKPWDRSSMPNIQQKIDSMKSPELDERPDGPATVETYTVMHNRSGAPETAIIVARLENGKRCWANSERDQALFKQMETEEFIGKKGTVSPRGMGPNIMRF